MAAVTATSTTQTASLPYDARHDHACDAVHAHRLSGGLLLRELLRAAPEALRARDAEVLPTAFGARMDEDKDVAAAWGEVGRGQGFGLRNRSAARSG